MCIYMYMRMYMGEQFDFSGGKTSISSLPHLKKLSSLFQEKQR